jgi:short-subunit dehydrogenase
LLSKTGRTKWKPEARPLIPYNRLGKLNIQVGLSPLQPELLMGNSTTAKSLVLLTGATSGIGKHTALALAKAGYPLALVARSQEKLQQVCAEIESLHIEGAVASYFPQDLTDLAGLASLIEKIENDRGSIGVLINNAGMGYIKPLLETPIQEWQQVLDLNLTAVFALIQPVVRRMVERREGLVVNLCSVAALKTFPDWGAYSASKFALLALSRTLAQEVRTYGVRVTALCPGAVDTPLWDSLNAGFDRNQMLSAETVAQWIVQTLALPPQAVLEEAVLMPAGGAL